MTSVSGQIPWWWTLALWLPLAFALPGMSHLDTHFNLVEVQAAHASLTDIPDELLLVALQPPDTATVLAMSAAALEVPGVEEVIPDVAAAPRWLAPAEARRVGLRPHAANVQTLGIRARVETADARLLEAIRAVPLPTGTRRVIGGLPALDVAHARTARDELRLRLPLVASVMCMLLTVGLGSFRLAVVCLSSAVMACLTLAGALGWAGLSLGGPQQLLLPLVLVFGLADSVHLVMQAQHLSLNGSTGDAPIQAVTYVARPCLWTSVTTAMGFLALGATSSAALQTFGLYAAGGMALAWFYGLGFPTWVMMQWPLLTPRATSTMKRGLIPTRRHAAAVLVGITALACMGVAQLHVNIQPGGELLPTDPLHEDMAWLDRKLGGLAPLTIDIVQRSPMSAEAAAVWTRWSRRLNSEDVGVHIGPGEVLEIAARREGRTGEQLLRGQTPIAQRAWRQLRHSLQQELGELTVFTPEGGRVHARLYQTGSARWADLLDSLSAKADGVASVSFSGWPALMVAAHKALFPDLSRIMLATLIATLCGTGWLLGGIARGLVAVIPISLTALCALGTLGWTHVALAPTNVFVVSAGMGVGIDALIHLLGSKPGTVTQQRVTERAVVWTTGLLLAGLATLATSPIPTLRNLGLTLVITMFASLLSVISTVAFVTPEAT
ncbi:MAG: hypothetical protein ACON4N_08375 [Myxococcota bacterium]